MTLTIPFVDDIAPANNKTLWFAILGLMQPVGVALGYIVMGAIAAELGWRSAFYVMVRLRGWPGGGGA